MPPFSVFYSNRVEELFQCLKQQLFPSAPFTRRLLVVPSPPLKSWLMLQLARDPDLGIAAGLEISYPEETLKKLGAPSSPPFLDLSLAIESQLRQLLQEKKRSDIWTPLFHYFEGEWSRKNERRLILLATELATLFHQYRHYGRGMVGSWEKGEGENWQAELWRRLYVHEPAMPFKVTQPAELHLFSMSHLSPLHLDCFTQLSRQIPTYFYQLSPCLAFWSDIRTDRESRRLHAFWKAKGASETQLEALDDFLRDCHPILANFGRLGREMVQQLEEREALSAEKYALPASFFEHPAFVDLIHEAVPEGVKKPISLLEALQADLLLMRTPAGREKIEADSIQVHLADTRLRETEVVTNLILQLLTRHAHDPEPLMAEEILVMAPDIMEYAPFIKICFSESALDFHIMEAAAPLDHPTVQGFLKLLKLADSRWTAEELIDLFSHPSFCKKQRFTAEELETLKLWIGKSGIRWGQTAQHRDELLKRQHCLESMVETSETGTWNSGIERLLMGLVNDDENILIESTQAELLGKFYRLMGSLKQDLLLLREERTLQEWTSYLECLFEAYFDDDEELLFSHFAAFGEVKSKEIFPFSTILWHLEESLKRQRTSYRETHLHAVRFCPLLPMRTLPAKVVILMGMQEGVFPRYEGNYSLNLLQSHPKADYCPTKTDFDRYLFLEALLSARQYLIMTYHGENKEQAPSLLVQELLAYLCRAYQLEEEDLIFRHPFHSFDKRYFESDARFPSYSPEQYRLAQAFYTSEKRAPFLFIPDFPFKEAEKTEIRLDIAALSAFAKNPLKVYFNKALGLYFPKDAAIEPEEPFALDRLDHHILRKIAFTNNPEEALATIQLPFGLFKEVALKSAVKTMHEILENLDQIGVRPKELFRIELNDRIDRPVQRSETLWEVPALKIGGVTLVGVLEDVSPQGLIALSENKCDRAVQHLPQFLIYDALLKTGQLPFERQLLFARSGEAQRAFTDPTPLLSRYLDIYLQGLKTPVPLLPKWVPLLLKQDPSGFKKKLEESLEKAYQPELLFVKGVNAEVLLAQWKPIAESLFADLNQNWYST